MRNHFSATLQINAISYILDYWLKQGAFHLRSFIVNFGVFIGPWYCDNVQTINQILVYQIISVGPVGVSVVI